MSVIPDCPSARQALAADPAHSAWVSANAGSGKTRVLTRRIAYGARSQRIEPNHTLTLTFTRKAAGELKLRLRQKLDEARTETEDPEQAEDLEELAAEDREDDRAETERIEAERIETDVNKRFETMAATATW